MNQIRQHGNPKDFGHEFNYAQWTANNNFTLCNVPWNNDYRDVHTFDTYAELNDYIDSRESPRIEIQHATRAKIDQPIRVQMTLGKAMKYNYLRVQNGLSPVTSGDEELTLYYFIVGMREINAEVTEIIVQLDIWSTFRPQVTAVRGYIERGHIGVANSKRMQNNGRDYLTVPEGLDTGSEYRGVAVRNHTVMSPPNSMNVIAVFANDPTAPKYRTVEGRQVPNYTSATGSIAFGIPTGAMVRMWASPSDFMAFMADNRNTPWVTQGIMSIMLVPDMNRYGLDNIFTGYDPYKGGAPAPSAPMSERQLDLQFNNWRTAPEYTNHIPARYRHLDKLKTFPYTLVEMTTLTATPIILKPENWATGGANLIERASLLPSGARIQFAPRGYGQSDATGVTPVLTAGDASNFAGDRGGTYWDLFTQITNLPTVPIVNDGGILALAGQANSIAYGNQSAEWSQQRALQGAQTGYDQTTSAMQLNRDMNLIGQQGAAAQNNIQNQLARDQAVMGLIGGTAMGAGMGAMAGPAGAGVGALGGAASGAMSAMQTMMQMNARNDSLVANWSTQNAGVDAQNAQSGYVRDTNRDLAQFAARGDYENTIAGMNARVRDTEMTPASVVGQLGGELMNLTNKTFGISLRWKMIDNAAIRVIGEYWLRYGYAVRQFAKLPNNLRCMSKFTYWKLSETYLSGAHIPETYRQGLRGILEKGVTVWTNPDDIDNPDFDIADNTIMNGISLP